MNMQANPGNRKTSPARRSRASRCFLTALLPLTLAACAPDAWKPDSPFDAFLGEVRNTCWNKQVGRTTIDVLMPTLYQVDDYFMDITSRLYHGRISEASYLSALAGFYDAQPDSPGVRCILGLLPGRAPTPPSTLPPVIK